MITKVKQDYIFGLDEIKSKVIQYCRVLMSNDEKLKIAQKKVIYYTNIFILWISWYRKDDFS